MAGGGGGEGGGGGHESMREWVLWLKEMKLISFGFVLEN